MKKLIKIIIILYIFQTYFQCFGENYQYLSPKSIFKVEKKSSLLKRIKNHFTKKKIKKQQMALINQLNYVGLSLSDYKAIKAKGYYIIGVDCFQHHSDSLKEETGNGFLLWDKNGGVYNPFNDGPLTLNTTDITHSAFLKTQNSKNKLKVLVIGGGTGFDSKILYKKLIKVPTINEVSIDVIDINPNSIQNIKEDLKYSGIKFQNSIKPILVEENNEFHDLENSYDIIQFQAPNAIKDFNQIISKIGNQYSINEIKKIYIPYETFINLIKNSINRLSKNGICSVGYIKEFDANYEKSITPSILSQVIDFDSENKKYSNFSTISSGIGHRKNEDDIILRWVDVIHHSLNNTHKKKINPNLKLEKEILNLQILIKKQITSLWDSFPIHSMIKDLEPIYLKLMQLQLNKESEKLLLKFEKELSDRLNKTKNYTSKETNVSYLIKLTEFGLIATSYQKFIHDIQSSS